MKTKQVIIGFLLFLTTHAVFTQDIQFSQFYAASLYLNPAFAGSAHNWRAMAHERAQWPGQDAKYSTSLLSFDTYFSKYNSGFGLLATHDIQGSNVLKSSDIQLIYSYELPITKTYTLRAGLQGGYVSRSINYLGLIFPDQYNSKGFSGGTQDNISGNGVVNYFDFATGTVLYNDSWWFGASAHHINTPEQSFSGVNSRLPAKIAFVAGYRFRLFKKSNSFEKRDQTLYLIPTAHYKFQGKSDQLDIGLYAIYNDVIGGIWYRGLPIKYYQRNLSNNESIVVTGGYKFKNISISYSYDITISLLKLVRTAGAHEFNITYTHSKIHKKKLMRRLPCPKFNEK